MIITKKVKTLKNDLYVQNFLEDVNASPEQVKYLIGGMEYELEVIHHSMKFGEHDYFQPTHYEINDYILVTQNYYELTNLLDILKNYYEQMTNADFKGGD